MKVAIVHDQLREFGGAERVLVALKKIFPNGDIYTSTYDAKSLGPHKKIIASWNVKTSWFGKIPLLNQFYSPFRFLTPCIWESFDFSKYDLVISSSGSWMCKGIRTKSDRPQDEKQPLHISYIHHPPRYLYGYETAIEWQKYPLIKLYGNIVNHFLRIWDFNSSERADYFIANSEETRKRIQKFYRRDAVVIYPPVTIPNTFHVSRSAFRNSYYITVSRLARAKHVDILIKAANKEKFHLKIVGTGRDQEYLKSIAGKTVEFLGNIDDAELTKVYQNAKAFLFASVDEEFGIVLVEAMGYGVPAIAYKSGGVPEIVKDETNGFLFNKLTPESLIQKLKKYEALSKEEQTKMKLQSRKTSETFSEETFKKKILDFIHNVSPQ